MDEIRTSDGEKEKEVMRKAINERGGLRVSHTHTHTTRAAYWFTVYPEVQICIKASNSLSSNLKGDSHLPSPPSQAAGWRCDRIELDPFWLLTHVSLHFILLAVHSPVTKMKFSQHPSCSHWFLPSLSFFPVGSGVTVGSFFGLSSSVELPPLLFRSSSNSITGQ